MRRIVVLLEDKDYLKFKKKLLDERKSAASVLRKMIKEYNEK